jgi:anti-sigma factor RsiW
MNDHDTADDRATSALIRATATRHVASQALRDRVVTAIGAASADGRAGTSSPARGEMTSSLAPRHAWWPRLRTAAIAASAFACGALLATAVTGVLERSTLESRIENDVLSAHARAVMLARATDVVSSDRHTVKPWLSSRLDFSPDVVDLAADGYPLAGGRLDYVGGRTVAALVYQRNRHVIDVFVWPAASGAPLPPPASRNGLHSVAWDQGGLRYWAVSDIGPAELAAFGALLRTRTAAS